MNRRKFIKSIGVVFCSSLIPDIGLSYCNVFDDQYCKDIYDIMSCYRLGLNDDITRSRMLTDINNYHNTLNNRRIYKVVCDRSNNYPELIDKGKIVSDVWVDVINHKQFIFG